MLLSQLVLVVPASTSLPGGLLVVPCFKNGKGTAKVDEQHLYKKIQQYTRGSKIKMVDINLFNYFLNDLHFFLIFFSSAKRAINFKFLTCPKQKKLGLQKLKTTAQMHSKIQ